MAVSEGPVFTSERLEYWRPQVADLAALYAIVTEPETEQFIGQRENISDQFERHMRNAGSWACYGYGSFSLRRRGEDAIVGTAGVFHSWRGLGADVDDMPEIGWILGRDHVGDGLGRECGAASLAWFDAEFGRQAVSCFVAADNAPSLAIAARLGFELRREALFPDGALVKVLIRPGDQRR